MFRRGAQGPSQMARMMLASVSVKSPHGPALVPIRTFGSKLQRKRIFEDAVPHAVSGHVAGCDSGIRGGVELAL